VAFITTLVGDFKTYERDIQDVDPVVSTVIANVAKAVLSKVEEYRNEFYTTTTIANNVRWGRYSGGASRQIYVSRPPIQSVTNIWDDSSYAWSSALASSTYVAFPRYVQLLSNWGFAAGNLNVRIDYVSGWKETSIPAFIKSAILQQMGFEWKRNAREGQDWLGIESISSQGQTIVPLQGGLLPSVKHALDYQRPNCWGAQ